MTESKVLIGRKRILDYLGISKEMFYDLEARLDEMPKPAGSGDDVAVFKQQLVDRLEVEAEACNGQNQATRAVMAVQVAVESTIGEE